MGNPCDNGHGIGQSMCPVHSKTNTSILHLNIYISKYFILVCIWVESFFCLWQSEELLNQKVLNQKVQTLKHTLFFDVTRVNIVTLLWREEGYTMKSLGLCLWYFPRAQAIFHGIPRQLYWAKILAYCQFEDSQTQTLRLAWQLQKFTRKYTS